MRSRNCRKATLARGTILGAMLLAALTPPLSAQRVKDGQSGLDRLTFARPELRVSQTLIDADALKAPLANLADLRRFRSEYGPAWRFLIDQRTGHLNLLEGGAIPFIPGPANQLQWESFGASPCGAPSCISVARMESLARDFLNRNRDALQVDPDELVLDPAGASPTGNSLYHLRFQWVHGGVPVEGGSVFLAVNNGNLVQVGTPNAGDLRLDPKPTVPLEAAWQTLKSYAGGMSDEDQVLDRGTLAILPVTPKGLDPDSLDVPFGKMLDYVLVYKLAFRRPGVLGDWEALVDAHSGELLRFRDSNVYGHVQGGVYKTDAPQTETVMSLPKADFGAGTYADTAGNFAGIFGTSSLTGPATGGPGVAGGVKISDNCGGISLAANGVGFIDFGAGPGTDCATPNASGGPGDTHAARTQYWNVTQIKMKAISYLQNNPWLQGQLQDNVNINSVCNAYWNGSTLNFFKSGGGCANTGELPGVSLHEWGHGMDANDGSGGGTDNRPLESRADWTALLQTHQSCAGSGFFAAGNCSGYGDACTGCSGIREADYALHVHPTPWTPQNKGMPDPGYNCSPGSYNGPCGWEDHCESGIATQALWDFVNRDLVGAPTHLPLVTAWQLEDRLFYTGMPQSTNMYTCTGTTTKVSNGCGAGSLYTVMRAIDDDGDGVANGTPHAAAIFAALDRHHIACGTAGDPANQNQTSCPALGTPAPATTTASGNQITLSWTTGGGAATRYFVFRNETGCNAGFTQIATVNAPAQTYSDSTVAQGLTYYYRIQAATANDSCVSPMSACATVAAQLPADQDFYVRDWTSSAASHDNGEEPSTNYATNWAWTSDVWNRGTNTPGTPANDWYPTDNMYAGSGALGNNYGFLRIHRNAAGSSAAVTAQLLVSEFGAGSNFLPVGTPMTLNFAPGDLDLVQSSSWQRPATLSTHACMAVQISTPTDPYQPPALAGHSPGDPDGQSLLLVDNNKAQRNLGVSLNVAHFTGIHFALIHNPALFRRDIVLRYESPAAEQLAGAQIEVVGGKAVDFRSGTLTLAGLQPGENRWIGLKLVVPAGDPVPVHFYQLDGDRVVDAFTVQFQAIPLAGAIRNNLNSHVQVFNRLAAAFGIKGGEIEAQAASQLLRLKEIGATQYLNFLKARAKGMNAVLTSLVKQAGPGDAFGALQTLKDLSNDINRAKAEQASSDHGVLLNRLDSFTTMLQKAQGDSADILQMVRWQEKLYRTRPALGGLDCSRSIVSGSQELIKAYDPRNASSYPALLRTLSACFHQTAKALEKDQRQLEQAASAMERTGLSATALEKAHKELLLLLQDASDTEVAETGFTKIPQTMPSAHGTFQRHPR